MQLNKGQKLGEIVFMGSGNSDRKYHIWLYRMGFIKALNTLLTEHQKSILIYDLERAKLIKTINLTKLLFTQNAIDGE